MKKKKTSFLISSETYKGLRETCEKTGLSLSVLCRYALRKMEMQKCIAARVTVWQQFLNKVPEDGVKLSVELTYGESEKLHAYARTFGTTMSRWLDLCLRYSGVLSEDNHE